MKLYKKIIAIILCFFISFSFTFSAYAMPPDIVDIEQLIIDQTATGELEYQPHFDENGDIQPYMSPLVALTGPEVALLIAAGYGVYYTATNADLIYNSLSSALNSAAETVEGGVEYLANWWDNAKTNGSIAIGTAQSWVSSAISNWANSIHNDNFVITVENDAFKPITVGDSVLLDYYGNTLTYDSYLNAGSIPLGYTARFIRVLENSDKTGLDVYVVVHYFIPQYAQYIISGTTKKGSYSSSIKINGVNYYGIGFKYSWSDTLYYANENFDEYYSKLSYLVSNSHSYDEYSSSMGYTEGLLQRFINGTYSLPSGNSICPDSLVGGIGQVLGSDSINDLVMPDINAGSIDAESMTLQQLQEKLISGEISWSEYWDLVGVGDIAVPYVKVGDLAFPITDTGVSDKPITNETDKPIEVPPNLPENPSLPDYAVNLTDFFPFCIPFDIYDFLSILASEPETPVYTFMFPNPLTGEKYELTLDLSAFDGVATILRNMLLLLFIIGLAIKTRDLIRG